jgi:signal transduction histidine kinase
VNRSWLATDGGLALGVFGLTLGLLGADGFGEPVGGVRHLDELGALLAALSTLPLAARRIAPVAVYLSTVAGTLALLALGYPLDVPFGTCVAVYQLAFVYSGDRRASRRLPATFASGGFAPAVGLMYGLTGYDLPSILPELVALALIMLGVWFAGDRARLRRAELVALREHAERVERETERERRLAAAEERTRIARELHDSAGHAINVILVQAGAARLLQDRDPERSRHALGTIEQVARDTIGEIDRLVRALRTGDDATTDAAAEPAPADPAAFEALVERHRASGLSIDSDVSGSRTQLPRSVAWAAYRILQEALTNAARHGRGDADVSVRLGPDAAEITVTNQARRAPSATGGHGIVGMRERATLLGGSLHTGVEGGVFRLHAQLPYREALQ